LLEEISAIEKSNAAASTIRSTENGDYKKASTDFKEAIEAISQAMVVLKDFYRGEVTTSHGNIGERGGDQFSREFTSYRLLNLLWRNYNILDSVHYSMSV
jgi:hypothetical protein